MSLNDLDRITTLSQQQLEEKNNLLDKRRQIAWWMALVWTIGLLDSYVDAQLYNFESDLSLDKAGDPRLKLSFKINY